MFTRLLNAVCRALWTDKYTAVGSCFASTVIYQHEEKTVTETVLKDVYKLLHSIDAVKSESEFSRDWLGRSECYLRTLRFKGTDASVGAVAICASKLQHYGIRMVDTQHHATLGRKFIQLSEQCHKYINTHSEAQWLDDMNTAPKKAVEYLSSQAGGTAALVV